MMTKIYLCPSDKKYGCSWEGSSDDILDHFIQEHEDILYYTNCIDINLDILSENYLLFVDTEIYLLQSKILDGDLCLFLRYLGPAKLAATFSFDVDLLYNGKKIDKHNIKIKNGCFSTGLDIIKLTFGDTKTIGCQLSISGSDCLTNSSDDGVFLEDTCSPEQEKPNANENCFVPRSDDNFSIEDNGRFTTTSDFSDAIEKLDTTTKEEHLVLENDTNILKSVEVPEHKTKWFDTLNFLFGEPDSPKLNQSPLQRSQTFSTDDLKKRNQPKRHLSMRSLSSIKESDLEFELKCFNCNSHLAPPIYLCEFDHNICANCFQNDKLCSACNLKITAERNLELEEKSIKHLFLCKNQKNGCQQQLSYQDIFDHEINCTFCSYICPMNECGYKATYKSMLSHLSLIHSSIKMHDSFTAVFQKHTEVFLGHEKMGIFYCTLEVFEDRVMWKAQFCGPKERKFFCELKFKGKTFKYPLLLVRHINNYIKEIPITDLKEQKLKSKNSILTITR